MTFQDERVQMAPDDALVVEAEWARARLPDHIGGLVIVVAVVAAMLREGRDEGDAFGSPGAPTALSVVGRAGWDVLAS